MPDFECQSPFCDVPHSFRNAKKVCRVSDKFKKRYPNIQWKKFALLCSGCRIALSKKSKLQVSVASADADLKSPVKKKLRINDSESHKESPEPSRELFRTVYETVVSPVKDPTDKKISSTVTQENCLDVSSSTDDYRKDPDYEPEEPISKEVCVQKKTTLKDLNLLLTTGLHISPLRIRNLRSKEAVDRKSKQIGDVALALAVGAKKVNEAKESKCSKMDSLILTHLLLKYQAAVKSSEKIQIMTIAAAAGLTVDCIATFFGSSKYLAGQAIELFHREGIMSTPSYKWAKEKNSDLDDKVIEFYLLEDEVSKQLPGRKDFVTVKQKDGQKVQLQKRLLLVTLKNAHELFCKLHPELKVGFTKFTMLRPPQVVLPGSQGTLVQCLCVYHENPKLLFEAMKKILKDKLSFNSCSDLIQNSMCTNPTDLCHFGDCNDCPRIDTLMKQLKKLLRDCECNVINCGQWISTEGKCRLEVEDYSRDEFLLLLSDNLIALRPHRYLVLMQHKHFDDLKNNLKEGEVIVLGDYAENFTFVLQDAVQAQHWNKDQATIHIFVALYKENGVLKQINHVVVSEYHKHETKAVHLFQVKLMAHLKERLPFNLKKVYYYTDGCASQYKNRFNFCNLLLHSQEFGIQAEWHFHPTSHGKNRCDGIAGTLKRLAYRASLQRSAVDQIDTVKKLFTFISDTMPSIICDYTTTTEHLQHNAKLTSRFTRSLPVEGCRSQHAFIPLSANRLIVKRYSLSPKSVVHDMSV